MKRHITYILILQYAILNGQLAHAQQTTPLPPPIDNDQREEHMPFITPDGTTMLYISSGTGIPEMYESYKLNSGEWSPPQPITKINERARAEQAIIGGPVLSYDGNLLIFHATFKDSYGREDLYYCYREGRQWSEPQHFNEQINSKNFDGHPSLSPDGKSLYFARLEHLKTRIDNSCPKLMVAIQERSGKWRKAIEVPGLTNGGCITTPRMLPDGETLLFSSRSRDESQAYSVFKSTKKANAGWSTPVLINSVSHNHRGHSASASIQGDALYYTFNQKLFKTVLDAPLYHQPLAIQRSYIKDAITRKPVAALASYIDQQTGSRTDLQSNSADGLCQMIIRDGANYDMIVSAEGYEEEKLEVKAEQSKEDKVFTKNILLYPVHVQVQLLVKDVATNEPVKASVALLDEQKTPVATEFDSTTSYYTVEISMRKDYQLQVSHDEYGEYDQSLRIDSIRSYDPVPVRVSLKKIYHKFYFKPVEPRYGDIVNDAVVRIKDLQEDIELFPEVNAQTGEHIVELKDNTTYEVSISASRFEDYVMKLNTASLIEKQGFYHTIQLNRQR